MTTWWYRERDRERDSLEARYRTLLEVYRRMLLLVAGDAEEALRWLASWGERQGLLDDRFDIDDFRRRLEREGQIERAPGGGHRLSPGGEIALRRDALERTFASLSRAGPGDHRIAGAGPGKERLSETRPYRFGDDVSDLDLNASVGNALRRTGGLELREDHLEVYETEAQTACATCIAIDISHSMTLYGEDRITPARQVALAMVELIRTRFPRDHISVILFGDDAVEVPIDRLPYIQNGPYHTNTREALRLGGRLLSRRRDANRQIFMITDGKPSALTERDGSLFKNPFGLDARVVNKTLEEAQNLRRRGITISTFMLTDDPYLVRFVEDLTRANRGRAFFASSDRLGSIVLVDYLKNRRSRL